MNLFQELKDSCKDVWHDYTHPEFIDKLQDRTLDMKNFQFYLKQDYLYLIHYAKCFALLAYKGTTFEEIQFALKGTKWITEGEMELHNQYEDWGITRNELLDEEETIECIAYTRYMKDVGVTGDYLELMVAIASCYIGYAEIGERLIKSTNLDDHPYAQWIEMYGSSEYMNSSNEFIDYLNGYGKDLSKVKLDKLKKIFKDVTKQEVAFWKMGLRGE